MFLLLVLLPYCIRLHLIMIMGTSNCTAVARVHSTIANEHRSKASRDSDTNMQGASTEYESDEAKVVMMHDV